MTERLTFAWTEHISSVVVRPNDTKTLVLPFSWELFGLFTMTVNVKACFPTFLPGYTLVIRLPLPILNSLYCLYLQLLWTLEALLQNRKEHGQKQPEPNTETNNTKLMILAQKIPTKLHILGQSADPGENYLKVSRPRASLAKISPCHAIG